MDRITIWGARLATATAIGALGFAALATSTPRPRTPAARAAAPVAIASGHTPALAAVQAPRAVKPAAKPVAAPAAQPYVIKRILPIDGPMQHGDWYWNDAGVPAGPVIITVDLRAQVLSIFRSGYEIGTAVILYGADFKPTPTGVFPITQKDAKHVSNIYTGAPMPYMLRLTNDGITVHGTTVKDGYMTHGCVGVPTPFAKKLFDAVKLGDKVIVTNGETLGAGQAISAA